eukprot:253490_1
MSTICNCNLDECNSVHRVKFILERYSKIISDHDQKTKSVHQFYNEANQLINSVLSNGQYSNQDLLNDFFHIKYDHNVNEDSNQFHLFHKYLFLSDNISRCDINNCIGVTRHYNRNKRFDSLTNSINNTLNDTYAFDFLCRMHTYFIHSYDTTQFTNAETMYIEEKLNELKQTNEDILHDKQLELLSTVISNKNQNISTIAPASNYGKFITTQFDHSIDYNELSAVLSKTNLLVDEVHLAQSFDEYSYNETQLLDDICQVLIDKNEENVLLAKILTHEFNVLDKHQRQMIYGLLCHEYLMINNRCFGKILLRTALKSIPNIDSDQIKKIVQHAHLNSKIFMKGNKEFKNSVKFAKLFSSIDNWNKKKWTKIYTTMSKWKAPVATIPKQQVQKISKNEQVLEENKYEEKKMNQNNANHINEGTDAYLIDQFCEVTNASRKVAVTYLQQAEWNVLFAINTYCKTNQILKQNIELMHLKSPDDIDTEGKVYNHGVTFWYWQKQKSEKRFINKTYANLKEEILQFKQFDGHNWTNLIDECNILMKTEILRKMTSNGNKGDIYEIEKGAPITLDHLCAVKLYTDYSWLCKIFCEAFRKKKISESEYERVQSVQRRNEKVANWARLLVEAVQSYGKFMTGKTRYYRGVTNEFIFKRFITKFNVPLSTTVNFTKATEFADGDKGLVMELKRYNEYMPGFDCSIVSVFDEEREILFFGGDSIFQICSIYQWYDNQWSS